MKFLCFFTPNLYNITHTTMKITLPILTAGLLLTACSGNQETTQKKATVEVENADQEVSIDDDFVLPQPITLAIAFRDAGLTYNANKTNPISAKDSYSLKIDQLLNLGVYSTDLAYCAINNKSQEARDYLSAVQSLASKVGMESVFSDKAMIEKFDKNLGDQTALEDLIYELQDKSESYLADNDLRHVAAVQFAGAWIEGIFLGIDDSRKKANLGVAIVDQMNLLKNTIKGLESHPTEDARLKEVTAQFKAILFTYEGFASVKAAEKNVNFEVPKLTPEEFDLLAQKITAVRTNVVSPSKK